MKFKLGGIVVLRSGGPDMVMETVANDGGIVCIWFDSKRLKRQAFQLETLRPSRKPKEGKVPDFVLKFVDGDGNVVSTRKLGEPAN